MKKYWILFLLGTAGMAGATIPEFIREGSVYAFLNPGISSDSTFALVEKIDSSGWIKIAFVKSGQSAWLNLAQVHTIIPSQYSVAQLREVLIREKVAANLKTISAALIKFRQDHNGQEADSVRQLFGSDIPLVVEDGEDYSITNLNQDPLMVKTRSGFVVTYPRPASPSPSETDHPRK